MDHKAKNYLGELHLLNIDWVAECDDKPRPEYAILLTEWCGDYAIELGLSHGDGWLSPDNMSWCGPIKNVVAWADLRSFVNILESENHGV